MSSPNDPTSDRADDQGAMTPSPVRSPRASALAWVGLSVWCGLVVGLVELGIFLARVHFVQSGLYRKNPHVLWMLPASLAAMFALGGLGLILVVRPIPKIGRVLPGYVLCTLTLVAPMLAIPGFSGASALMLAFGLAVWATPAIRQRAEGLGVLARRSLPALALVVLGLAGLAFAKDRPATRGGARAGAAAPAKGPNVLLVVMDTVRADATSLGGSGRDTTPNLAALSRRGVRFDRAISTAPYTLPSHASMFTGRWAWELLVGPDRPLDARFPTLAEYLGGRGYETAGFVANTAFCGAEYGLARGFGHYEDYEISAVDFLRSSALGWLAARRLGSAIDRVQSALGREACHPFEANFHRKEASSINEAALRWISGRRDRPFFAFLNYFDVHDPYLVPVSPDRPFGTHPRTLAERRTLRDWISETPRPRAPQDLRLARDAYDECLAYLDGQLGRLLAGLGEAGKLDDTILIITSDHGEHFGEHEGGGQPLVGHRQSVYQAEVHVPLLIVAPGRIPAEGVVPDAVSLRDLPATVVDLLGLRDGSPFPGRSLLEPRGPEDGGESHGVVLSELNLRTDLPVGLRYQADAPGLMRAVVTEDRAYHRRDDGGEVVYDLHADPEELQGLTDDGGAEADLTRLREALGRLVPAEGELGTR
jgi:arylsulfatase A-like enzyme